MKKLENNKMKNTQSSVNISVSLSATVIKSIVIQSQSPSSVHSSEWQEHTDKEATAEGSTNEKNHCVKVKHIC